MNLDFNTVQNPFNASDSTSDSDSGSGEDEETISELEMYLRHKTEKTKDPVDWWRERRTLYPRLSQMALDYLTVPGMLPK